MIMKNNQIISVVMSKLKLFTKLNNYCFKCNKEDSLLLVDKFNNKYDLSKVDNNLLNTKEIYYFQCKYCGNISLIDWRDEDKLPKALSKNFIKQFIKHYSKSKL